MCQSIPQRMCTGPIRIAVTQVPPTDGGGRVHGRDVLRCNVFAIALPHDHGRFTAMSLLHHLTNFTVCGVQTCMRVCPKAHQRMLNISHRAFEIT